MTRDTALPRRAFLQTGALLALPIAAPAAAAIGGADPADETAIRALHQTWLGAVNRGAPARTTTGATIRRIVPDPADGTIRIAGDRATGRFACTIEIETALATEGTFAQMARLQGNSPARTERGRVTADYAKTEGAWTIAKITIA